MTKIKTVADPFDFVDPFDFNGIMERLGTSAEFWESRMKKLLGKSRLLGSYFATRCDRLKEIATRRGVHHVDNAVGGLASG